MLANVCLKSLKPHFFHLISWLKVVCCLDHSIWVAQSTSYNITKSTSVASKFVTLRFDPLCGQSAKAKADVGLSTNDSAISVIQTCKRSLKLASVQIKRSWQSTSVHSNVSSSNMRFPHIYSLVFAILKLVGILQIWEVGILLHPYFLRGQPIKHITKRILQNFMSIDGMTLLSL